MDTDSLYPVTKLNDLRDDSTTYNNRLDTLLADVFSLLSLFYLTIGKTRDTPATYCQIASMRVSHIPSIFTPPPHHLHPCDIVLTRFLFLLVSKSSIT